MDTDLESCFKPVTSPEDDQVKYVKRLEGPEGLTWLEAWPTSSCPYTTHSSCTPSLLEEPWQEALVARMLLQGGKMETRLASRQGGLPADSQHGEPA